MPHIYIGIYSQSALTQLCTTACIALLRLHVRLLHLTGQGGACCTHAASSRS